MQKVYAAYHNNMVEVEKSSSGAMFVALSDVVLENEGVIVAACYDYESHLLKHVVCRNVEERDLCRGSKYFQSSISQEIYKEIVSYLSQGTIVLFVGTPCQVAAVQKFCKIKCIDVSKLYTCDLICHGVGSPGMWKRYIYTKKYVSQISNVSFKDKKRGWLHPRCIAKVANKEYSIREYSWLYFDNAIMRPSCYDCQFTTIDRQGDFSIGDYWKVKLKTPEMYNEKGTSFVMVNTNKGEVFFDNVKSKLVYQQIDINDVIQNNMKRPTLCSENINDVKKDYETYPDKIFFKKWRNKLFINKVKQRIKRIIK